MQANSNIPLLLSILSSIGEDTLSSQIATSIAGNASGDVVSPINVWDINMYFPTMLGPLKNMVAAAPLHPTLLAQAAASSNIFFIGAMNINPADPAGNYKIDLNLKNINVMTFNHIQDFLKPEVIFDEITNDGNIAGYHLTGSLLIIS